MGAVVVPGGVVRVCRGLSLPFSTAWFCSKASRAGSVVVDGVCLSGPAQPVVGTIKLLQLRYLTDLHRLWGRIQLITFLGGGSNQCEQ